MMHKFSSSSKGTTLTNCRIPRRTLEATYASLQQTETPCRRNPRTRLQSHTHGLLLPKTVLRIRVEARANVTETCRYTPDSYSSCKRVCNPTLQRTSTQLDTSCPSRTRLNTSMMELVPVKRIERSHACTNAVELVISHLDRIEYKWTAKRMLFVGLIACALLQNVRCLLPSSPCNSIRAGWPR